MTKGANTILRLLFPETCPFCGEIVPSERVLTISVKGTKTRSDRICPSCRKKLVYIGEPRCMRCGKPVPDETKEYCADCENNTHEYTRGLALWIYDDLTANAIYRFKYHNKRYYGDVFAREMADRFRENVRRWKIDKIFYVPTGKKKMRARGYNHAELLAVRLGRILSLPVDHRLVRLRDTDPQKKMTAQERKRNLMDAFAYKGKGTLSGNVLVIDDIYTTGSTIDGVAKVLKCAGAAKVYFLTISVGQGY